MPGFGLAIWLGLGWGLLDDPVEVPPGESASRDEPGTADAPESTPAAGRPELFVTEVALGASMSAVFFNLSRLDRAWTEAGAPGMVTTQWTPLAINGELWIGRHVPGIDIVDSLQARGNAEAGGVRTQFETRFTELSYGYAALHHRSGFSIVPRIGFGLVDATVTAHPVTTDGVVDFADVLADAGVSASLSKTSMVTDLGAMFTYLISFGPRDRLGMGTGLRVGLRVGGLIQLFDFGPQGDAWKSGPDPVVGAPDVRLDGGFIRLFLAPSMLHRSKKQPKPTAGR